MYRTALLWLHIAAVAGWLGGNFAQAFIAPRMRTAGPRAESAWYATSSAMARWYYNVAGVIIGVTGVLLVLHGSFSFGSGFVVLGIVTLVIGAALGALVFVPVARRLSAELGERRGPTGADALRTRLSAAGVIDTLLVLVTALAMVHRWLAR